jgi:hypothetical protein
LAVYALTTERSQNSQSHIDKGDVMAVLNKLDKTQNSTDLQAIQAAAFKRQQDIAASEEKKQKTVGKKPSADSFKQLAVGSSSQIISARQAFAATTPSSSSSKSPSSANTASVPSPNGKGGSGDSKKVTDISFGTATRKE